MSFYCKVVRNLSTSVLLLSAFVFGSTLRASTVDYRSLTTGSIGGLLDRSGVTATSSGTLYGQLNSGLGVVGGFSSVEVDSGESVTFTFDAGLQQSVVLNSNQDTCTSCNTASIAFTGLGAGGANLGTFSVPDAGVFSFNVSSLFSNAPLSGFTLTSNSGSGISVSSISFEPASAATPEPSSLLLLGSGMVGVFQAVRRKRVV